MFISNTFKTEIITVTPEIAEQLLARNTKNRNVSPANYRKIEAAMSSGEWTLNGEAIKIATDGTLLDGQHRLMVCRDLGIPFQTVVTYGLPRDTQDTMDTGKSRTVAGVFSLHGLPSATRLAAIVVALIRVERSGLRAALSKGASAYAVTAKQALNRIESEPAIADLIPTVRQVSVLTGGVVVPAVLYYAFSAIDAEDTDYFFEKLASGEGLTAGDPILVLRNLLIGLMGETRGERNQRYIAAVFIKAWNKYRAGETVSQLRFRIGGANPEQFPEPK